MNLFQKTLLKQNDSRPPVWFMRQAGRYHAHYQALRAKHSFIDLCKVPELACEVTMGPIRDFNFDAAILFSDLLFPLEAMGMGLSYEPGPTLSWHLRTYDDLSRLETPHVSHMEFQADAMKLIRKALPKEKGLIGFVGGPLTLFCYAVEGSHKGDLSPSKQGLIDGRYDVFCEKLVPMLAQNMALQARAGADTIAVMDTCAGEFTPSQYGEKVVPVLKKLFAEFKKLCPDTPITYYSKKTGRDHWDQLVDLPIAAIGIDWNHDIADVLARYHPRFVIQGNVDPDWLFLESSELEKRLREVFAKVKKLAPETRRGWICGLGHGVLPKTPEANVKLFLKLQREVFGS